jgi:hypothetical protein
MSVFHKEREEMSQSLMTDTTEKKIERLAMLIRSVSQRIEINKDVIGTLWLDDNETICDALYRASDELITIAESTDHPAGALPDRKA